MDFGGPMGFQKAAGVLQQRHEEISMWGLKTFFWRSPNFDRKKRYNLGEDLFFAFFFEITS